MSFSTPSHMARKQSVDGAGRAKRETRRSPQTELHGLARVVADGPECWELVQRKCDRRDLGHPCRSCGVPFTQMDDPVFVWKAATFIKRFHPACAESFNGCDGKCAVPSYSNVASGDSVPVNSYADAWRRSQLSDRAVQLAAERQAARQASERWPRYPTAGMLWRAGTLALQQEKKDAEGVAAWKRQMQALRNFTKAVGGPDGLLAEGEDDLECAICLSNFFCHSAKGSRSASDMLVLPCDRSHAFHAQCLEPWLQKNFRCPKCRADLRPLLDVAISAEVAASIRKVRKGRDASNRSIGDTRRRATVG